MLRISFSILYFAFLACCECRISKEFHELNGYVFQGFPNGSQQRVFYFVEIEGYLIHLFPCIIYVTVTVQKAQQLIINLTIIYFITEYAIIF